MTDNLSELPEDCAPTKCCAACTCTEPHRSKPLESDEAPAVNVQES